MIRRARVALAGALLLALASCDTSSDGDDADSRSAAATSSTAPTSAPASAARPEPTASSSAPEEPESATDACALLDLAAFARAELLVDRPQHTALRASDSADTAAALNGRDALLMCDAGFTASAQINDLPDQQRALQEATTALATAADTPTAVRTDLPPDRVPFGATVIDAEFQSASVQFQLRDLHVAIVVSYGGGAELSDAHVQQLLEAQLAKALAALG